LKADKKDEFKRRTKPMEIMMTLEKAIKTALEYENKV